MFLINPYILQASGIPLWNGIQAYYTADNTPNDALGTYNGTLTNGATYGTGIINNGFSFDGVNDYVDLGDVLSTLLDGTNAFSISIWVNPTAVSGTEMFLAKQKATSPFNGFIFGMTNGYPYLYLASSLTSNELKITMDTQLTVGSLQQLILTYDGSQSASGVTLDYNGSPTAITTTSDTLNTTISTTGLNLCIGARPGGSLPFGGVIDEIAIYNVVIPQPEKDALWNGGLGNQY